MPIPHNKLPWSTILIFSQSVSSNAIFLNLLETWRQRPKSLNFKNLNKWSNVSSGKVSIGKDILVVKLDEFMKNVSVLFVSIRIRSVQHQLTWIWPFGVAGLGFAVAPNVGKTDSVGSVWGRVSVQGVKSLGGHFACLCRGLDF